MADITKFVTAMAAGGEASSITGNLADAFPAGAYSGFIQSITGSVPTVTDIGDHRARLILSQPQVKQMQAWVEQQAKGFITPTGARPRVEYELGPVINPLLLKYTLPVAALIFIAGFIAAKTIFR